MLSVIIATRNRPEKIELCLSSVLKNTIQDFEIILLDKSDNEVTKQVVKKIKPPKISYLKLSSRGKTKAVNQGIKVAKGEILCFIDDDILVDKFWLKNIKMFFEQNKNNPKVAGVFGKILPYEPKKHQNQICPSIFILNRKNLVNNCYVFHYKDLGLGSNMSLKKEVLNNIGYFREWLGPGYLGLGGGEDGELIYRLLKNGYSLAYNPDIRAFHNRWLTYQEYRIQQGRYTCGEITFCCYYFLKGDLHMGKIILMKIIERVFNSEFKDATKKILKIKKAFCLKDQKRFLKELFFSGWEVISIIKGFLVVFNLIFREKIINFGSLDRT